MSGHLCLKWNNHSSAFLKSISTIQVKERYCDATIVCQGKYFPVHRIILSTCSDYFEEMFERMQCPHPYIVFKDIEPREMELLLNYMYQGEVNVVQEMLPTLIKAAEALRVKGLAVPDEMPTSSGGKKRSNTSNDNPQPKRRSEETKRKRMDSSEFSSKNLESFSNCDNQSSSSGIQADSETKLIKEEPIDTYENSSANTSMQPLVAEGQSSEESVFVNFPITEEGDSFSVKKEDESYPTEDQYDEQSTSWNDYEGGDNMDALPSDMGNQDDMYGTDDTMGYEGESSLNMEPNRKPPRGQNMDPSMVLIPPVCPDTNHNPSVAYDGNKVRRKVTKFRRSEINGQLVQHCPFCCYTSKLKISIVRHMRFKHTNEKPFSCTLCSSRFRLKTDLNRHVMTHYKEKPFKCVSCDKSFVREDYLKKHIVRCTLRTMN